MLAITIACSGGCAGPGSNTVAGNVATGATINALAGVPGAGIVGIVAMAADVISQSGQPKINKWSPEFTRHILQSPLCSFRCKDRDARTCKDDEFELFWYPRKKADGSLITTQNAPKRSMEYMETYVRSAKQYLRGVFGDTPEMQAKNLKAWEEGKTVVAEYHGPNNANLVYVSVNREPAEIMLAEEWATKKNCDITVGSESLKEVGSKADAKAEDGKGPNAKK